MATIQPLPTSARPVPYRRTLPFARFSLGRLTCTLQLLLLSHAFASLVRVRHSLTQTLSLYRAFEMLPQMLVAFCPLGIEEIERETRHTGLHINENERKVYTRFDPNVLHLLSLIHPPIYFYQLDPHFSALA